MPYFAEFRVHVGFFGQHNHFRKDRLVCPVWIDIMEPKHWQKEVVMLQLNLKQSKVKVWMFNSSSASSMIVNRWLIGTGYSSLSQLLVSPRKSLSFLQVEVG